MINKNHSFWQYACFKFKIKRCNFLYQNDLDLVKHHGMMAWNDKLKSVRFHEKLAQYNRVERIVKISECLPGNLNSKRMR